MTQNRLGQMRVICLRVVALTLVLAATSWAVAHQTGSPTNPCQAKKDYEAAKRSAEQAKQAFDKIKIPPEATDLNDLAHGRTVETMEYTIGQIENKDGFGSGITYQGRGTSYRQRLSTLLNMSREEYIRLYDIVSPKPLLDDYTEAQRVQARRKIKEIEAQGKKLEKTDPELGWIAAQLQWRQDWVAAVKRHEEADNREAETEASYGMAISAKDGALDKAKSDLDATGSQFNTEKDRLQALPHDDSYRQQSLQLIAKTRAALMGIRLDLSRYDCWNDVKNLMAEIDAKIQRLTAAMKGGSSKSTSTKSVPSKPNPPAAGADVWIADKPVIIRGSSSNFTASESSVSVTTTADGKSGTGTVTWSGIPARVKVGERVTVTINASGNEPGRALGWFNINCAGKWYQQDNNACSWPGGKGTGKSYNAGVMEFTFAPNSNPSIQVSAGKDPPGTWATITWKYHKAGANDRK